MQLGRLSRLEFTCKFTPGCTSAPTAAVAHDWLSAGQRNAKGLQNLKTDEKLYLWTTHYVNMTMNGDLYQLVKEVQMH